MSPDLAAQAPPDWVNPKPPEIPLGWEWAWRGWNRLDSDRQWHGGGFGPAVPGRIGWRDRADYCDRYGYDIAEFEIVVKALDDVYTEYHGARAKAAAEQARQQQQQQQRR